MGSRAVRVCEPVSHVFRRRSKILGTIGPAAGGPASASSRGASRIVRRLGRLAGVLRAALVVAALVGAGCGANDASTPAPPSAEHAGVTRPEVGFRSAQRLDEHHRKHGREFGAISRDEYLRLAQELRDRPVEGDVLEIVRRDGVITRFDRGGGTFIAFDEDGTIRTFFRPNDGEDYFRRQARR